MRMYRLKNGTIGECSMVHTIMLTIKGMSVSTLYELYKKAKDSSYKIHDLGIVQCLNTLCFLRPDDSLDECVQNVAESAISFENGVAIIGEPMLEIIDVA